MIRFAAGDAGIVDLSWSQIEALRDRIDRKGFPPEILEIKRAIAAADENCMKLCVLFGGIVDQSAVNECVRLRRLLDETYAKLAAQ